MLLCPNCRQTLDRPGKFCRFCGSPLKVLVTRPEIGAPPGPSPVLAAPAPAGLSSSGFLVGSPTNALIGPYRQAGFGLRLTAQMIDHSGYVLWLTLWMALGVALAGLSPFFQPFLKLVGVLGLPLLFIANALVAPCFQGQSLGKWLVGIRVVRADYREMTATTILKRHVLGYPLSLFGAGIGFLWMIWDRKQQGWHDKIARTLVVFI
jgi:uncharacterized RDD family membrane protein YckC